MIITYFNDNEKEVDSSDAIDTPQEVKELYCSDTQLTSLEGIENMRYLERLYCSNNRIISLNNIETLLIHSQ